jgi:hypothetical protein
MIEFFKVLSLFVAILYGIAVTVRGLRGQTVTGAHVVLAAAGATGFIYLQFLLK